MSRRPPLEPSERLLRILDERLPARGDREEPQREEQRREGQGREGQGRERDPGPDRAAGEDTTPVLQVPQNLRHGRTRVSPSAALGVLVVVLVAVAVLVVRLVVAQAGDEPVPVDPGGEVVATGDRSGFPGASAPAGTPGSASTGGRAGPSVTSGPAEVVVHVVGRVRSPGVVRLRAGDRVADALRAAGGARGGADLRQVNLARPVVDGEQVVVPTEGETPPPTAVGGPGPAAGGSAPGPGHAGAGPAGAPVDLNAADATALEALPGIGPVLAQKIIAWRSEHGRFTSVDELHEVSGIGEKLFAQLSPLVTV